MSYIILYITDLPLFFFHNHSNNPLDTTLNIIIIISQVILWQQCAIHFSWEKTVDSRYINCYLIVFHQIYLTVHQLYVCFIFIPYSSLQFSIPNLPILPIPHPQYYYHLPHSLLTLLLPSPPPPSTHTPRLSVI